MNDYILLFLKSDQEKKARDEGEESVCVSQFSPEIHLRLDFIRFPVFFLSSGWLAHSMTPTAPRLLPVVFSLLPP